VRGKILPIVVTALLAAAAGYFSHQYFLSAGPGAAGAGEPKPLDTGGAPLIGQPRPDYTLGSVNGERISSADFDGQVVLVNFWATWCAPCREEMPMLMELHEDYRDAGLEVVGIAIDDVQRARDFVAELDIRYPNLVGATDVMATMQLYGNASGTLPYSVLIDREGLVRWTKLGVLEQTELEQEIERLLAES
jgi:peroxiredoxin